MGWLAEPFKEIPLSTVLRERLAVAEDRVNQIESENKRLNEQIATLKAEAEVLKAQSAAVSSDGEFVEEEGVLWKRKKGGGFRHHPDRPTCELASARPRPVFRGRPCVCGKCSYRAPICEHDIKKVISRLTTPIRQATA